MLETTNYVQECNFKHLKPPNLEHIVKNELPRSPDWVGYSDKPCLLRSLSTVEAWSSFAAKLASIIKSSIDPSIESKSKSGKVLLLKKIEKTLVQKEEELIDSFIASHDAILQNDPTGQEMDNYFVRAARRGAIGVLARRMIEIIKHDMCSESSKFAIEITSLIDMVYAETNIVSCFKPCMLPTIYYIAGWHIMTCFKMSKRRRGNISDVMMNLFENATVGNEDGKKLGYSGKVTRDEMFGGLNYVSERYFHFVLRLEYVFVVCLTPTKLAVLGSRLMMEIYNKLSECEALRNDLECFVGDKIDEDVMTQLCTSHQNIL